MKRVTFKIEAETLESVDSEADDEGVSRSEYLRQIVHSRHEAARLRDEYEGKIASLEGKLDEANRRLAASNRQNDRVEELATFAENEQLQQRKQQIRDDKRTEAGVLTRASWWLTGGPSVSDEELQSNR